MKKNNFCYRTCIVTKQKKHKNDLIKFIILNQQAFLDINNQLFGRGYYILKDVEVINKLISNKIIEKKFKIINHEDFYKSLNIFIGGEYENQKTNQEECRHKKTS